MSSDVQIYVTVNGTRQGEFSGTVVVAAPNLGQSPALSALKFSYGVTSPSDLYTGQASGRPQHKPFVITREPSAASPQFFSALVTNELLTVVIQFLRTDVAGKEVLQQTITLTNARISDFLQYVGDDGRWLEDAAFIFQKIEIVNNPSQKTAADSVVGAAAGRGRAAAAGGAAAGGAAAGGGAVGGGATGGGAAEYSGTPVLSPSYVLPATTGVAYKDKLAYKLAYKEQLAQKEQNVVPSPEAIAPPLRLGPPLRFRS